ncbi:MAG: ABC transporter substrate-binding protein [Pseudomonadota bacterium]
MTGPLTAALRSAARARALLGPAALVLGLLSCATGENQHAPRHITYWEKWTGFEGVAMDAVVDDFNEKEAAHAAQDPSYAPIEVEKVTISNVEQKLLIAIAGGTPPDLAGNYSSYVAAYADGGALTDLGPMLRKAGFDRSAFIDHYMALTEYRGKTWAVPIAPGSIALLTNKRLFREAGLDPERPPVTIEELDADAEKLTKWEVTLPSGEKQIETGYLPNVPAERKRLIQAGFLPSEPGYWSYAWGYFFGGRLIDGADKITAADPRNIQGFDWAASYSKNLGVGVVKRFRSGFGTFASPQNAFLSGKVAMVLQGVWMHNFIEKYAPGLQWAAAPFPYPAGHPELANTTSAEADVLVIPKGSAHSQEAFEFIKYVTSQQALEKLCLGQQKFTPLKRVSDQFWKAHPNPYIRLFRELGTSKNAFSIPQTGIWSEYYRELNNAVDLSQNLTQTPQAALSAVQSKMQAALDRSRRIQARRQAQ